MQPLSSAQSLTLATWRKLESEDCRYYWMIPSFSSPTYPYLPIRVFIGDSFFFPDVELETEALLDTDFSGGLSVPPHQVPSTIPTVSQSIWRLADGSVVMVATYRGYVRIGTLPVVETEVITLPTQPLLGRNVTNQFRLLILDHGKTVTVEL